ncbi:kinase suppressor of Ras 1 isoform X2 [Lates calcarifer]|uniref:Kinase suppressor of Ras 1 isoform X2 n=1 Tax=Lates calcarifer TaxID=8187 RepID=A0AAJ7QHJ4_LATCA|nr:kinase suppressor of Ras 1 isoform X2 [Lates calcarifer]
MDREAGRGDKVVYSRTEPGEAQEALHQCQLIQKLVDISISSLQALRTKCAATNDLTQQEIRTLEVKLTKYIWRQLQWKQRIPERERPESLAGYPRLENWLLTADLTPQFIQAAAGKLSVDGLLQMSSSELQDTMRRLGSNSEDCSRLTAALSCLKSTDETGDLRPDSCRSEPQQDSEAFSYISPLSSSGSPSTLQQPISTNSPSISISMVPCSDDQRPDISADDIFTMETSTPSAIQTSKTRTSKPSHTPPLPSRKLLHLLPNIALTRSKSHESQLANRIEEPATQKACKKNKVLAAIQINGCGNSPEDSALRSPLLSARTPGPVPASAPYMMPATPTLLDNVTMHRSSPQTVRRDIGLAITHRFSTKSWLSQTCQVCQKSMMFGVKCKHCKFKCHNKCTKDALSCRISFLTLPRMRRAESVPSDINNRIDHTATIPLQYGTLPKAITKRLDSSSNPSSATSSTPSSPAHFQQSNSPCVSTPPAPNSSPQGSSDNRFYFPDPPASTYTVVQHSSSHYESGVSQVAITETQPPATIQRGEEEAEEHYPAENEEAAEQCSSKKGFSTEECDEDGLEDLPSSICRRGAVGRWRGHISRKASQTSVYLQEWDIPYEQLQLGELIGMGRWGKVHKGRWHGEVAIRLLEIDGNNQDHLKLFKKEVMNYRQTRHENVVLFMGACMAPPHLAIITSFCKGLTLYSVVRERGHMLDINKTRQIAQEIVKGMGYLHAKGIIHKDLKSKNVFYDTNKVVITDFGLFGMSGVVQEGSEVRRKNVLRIPQGWIYYLAPEIVRKMSPEVDEDQLPFSKAADVYAFGTIWYELHVGDWPITNQPVEAKIWLVGSSEGTKQVLAEANLGKEVTEILSACWSFEADDRPTFTQLAGMLERLPKLNRRLSHPGHFWKTTEQQISTQLMTYGRFWANMLHSIFLHQHQHQIMEYLLEQWCFIPPADLQRLVESMLRCIEAVLVAHGGTTPSKDTLCCFFL